jgi:hypothetical protein
MTNYEWLVKSGELARYISGWFIQMNPQRDGHMNFAIECANYLCAERKSKKYVDLNKVADLISLVPFKIPFNQKNFSREEVRLIHQSYLADLYTALGKMVVKEIDE